MKTRHVKVENNILDFGCGWDIVPIPILSKFPNLVTGLEDLSHDDIEYTPTNAKILRFYLSSDRVYLHEGDLNSKISETKFSQNPLDWRFFCHA